MPILYTDGNSNVDAAGGSQASGAHRDDRTYSDKKQKPRKKSVIGRFGRAVVKSFKANDKGCSRPKDVELANEKLRQINRADQLRKSTRRSAAISKRSAPTLGEQHHHHDLAGRLSDGMRTSSDAYLGRSGGNPTEPLKDALRYQDVSPVQTRHHHGITTVAGVRPRVHMDSKGQPEDTGSMSMHMHHSDSNRVNVAVLRQEVEESFAVIEAESPAPSSSMSTANLSVSGTVSRHRETVELLCVSALVRTAEDLASLGAQQHQLAGPAVLECGQMQEMKLQKSAGGDDCSQQRSVSKNTTLSDLRTASVAAAASAEYCAHAAVQLQDASVQTELSLQDPKNCRLWEALRHFFAALRDFFLCSGLIHKETNE